ncbi:DEAD/DEAH box helicase [bacterium]|nr:DEAD/DEAH box helicase [bacterium]
MEIDRKLAEWFPFPLDDFQISAMNSIEDGSSVIVCAPTGSGKTAVAEFAVRRVLEEGRRCFYTTPLKALSNQKFHDFREQFGENVVGLLTGDVSVNRSAPVVVMTTEVYRNMLYGTSLGEVERNLYGVQAVVLDECHYMNDPERGTVWEESIIYSPEEVQLIALSATVANADDLRAWFEHTHGDTDLVISYHRPVPLRHYYFRGQRSDLLFGKDGKLQERWKKVAMPTARKGFRKRPKAESEELARPEDVVVELDREDMLPAIYFVFSRKGCESSMERCRGKLIENKELRDEREAQIDAILKDSPSLAQNSHLPALYEGLAVHHAGLLPAWKSVVERLFQKGLIQVVFATETLAAGINMPARTTVISCISKYTGDGHRLLTASEFLQMSGRAGRRGMDKQGYVMTIHHPKETVTAVAKLARSEADPLDSNFRPGYGMVLNLLHRHSLESCRQLVEQSFGKFLAEHRGGGQGVRQAQDLLKELSQPLCPGEPGDLTEYRKANEREDSLRRQVQGLSRAPRHDSVRYEILRLKADRERIHRRILDSPCNNCPKMAPCAEQHHRRRDLEQWLKRTGSASTDTPYWGQFLSLCEVLHRLGYLEEYRTTYKGEAAAAIRASNTILLCEVIFDGLLERLTVPEIAAVLTCLVNEDMRALEQLRLRPTRAVAEVLGDCKTIAAELERLQRRHRVDVPTQVISAYAPLAYQWADGCTWDELLEASKLESGDLIRALRRTLDISRQLSFVPGIPAGLSEKARQIEPLLLREELRDSLSAMDA